MTLIEQIFTDYQEISGYLSDQCHQCSNNFIIEKYFNQPLPALRQEWRFTQGIL